MKLSSAIVASLVVAIIYLASSVHSSPTHDSLPTGKSMQNSPTIDYLATEGTLNVIPKTYIPNIKFIWGTFYLRFSPTFISYKSVSAINYVARNYPSVERMSRQLAPRGLDMEETLKVSVQKLHIYSYVIFNMALSLDFHH